MSRKVQFSKFIIQLLTLAVGLKGYAQNLSDTALAQIRFEQKLGTKVSPALLFRDEHGKQIQLGDYFGPTPVVLVLGYYECPMLCTLVLNGLVEGAADMRWSIGREFEVVDVSINPAETPTLANAKKQAYLKRYGRSSAAKGWHFLTGDQTAIRALTDQVGFRFAYDPVSKQYAHPSGLVVLTPEGKVSRYLFGVNYPSQELYSALREAASDRVGSPIQQLILLCFHYNPLTGRYSGTILGLLRFLSGVTLVAFLSLIIVLVRRGRAAEATLAAAANQAVAVAPAEPTRPAMDAPMDPQPTRA